MGHGRGDDEEGEERDNRQISEVAGVDEAVVVDADGDPLHHLPRRQPRRQLLLDLRAEGGAHAGVPLAAGLRRLGGSVSHFATAASNPKRGARVAGTGPAFDEPLQLGIVGRDLDFDRHQLVAALAVLGGEAAALEAQHLA